jgi:NAD(P)-dependent dehydrogenase (short-subunit alcohol dehydrogenase family)
MRTAMLDASAAVYGLVSPGELAVHHLTGTLLEPAEVAAFVAWLCSPASSAVTGAALPADAGLTTR